MTHKQHAVTLIKPWPHGGAFRTHLREIVANLKRMVEVPTGYQDETGFHDGKEPARKDVQWPPA